MPPPRFENGGGNMGMDIYGRNPTTSEGEYFHASISQWPVLVKIVTTLCPQETSGCKYWHTNDGDGLNAAQALALADALERKLRSREVAKAFRDPAMANHAEPPIIAAIEAFFGAQVVPVCGEAVDENYVAKFTPFVRASGGFSIW
jgi:hypothetical protein